MIKHTVNNSPVAKKKSW